MNELLPEGLDGFSRRAVEAFENTHTRTFKIFPALAFGMEALLRGGVVKVDLRFAPLLALGYYQHRLIGRYRTRLAGPGGGFETMPEAIVQNGPYAYTRNPMYLGDLIFTLGLALTLHSRVSLLLFVINAAMLQQRVYEDEARLANKFGAAYENYARRVKRWIPFVL